MQRCCNITVQERQDKAGGAADKCSPGTNSPCFVFSLLLSSTDMLMSWQRWITEVKLGREWGWSVCVCVLEHTR